MSHTKPEAEVDHETSTETDACGGLSDEELYLLDALDEVEQTIDAMSSVLANLRDRLADHLQGRTSGPTAVLEEWQDDPEPRMH
ncbi:MAG TPA: hypothetical protein VLA56_10875 [Pseudomonadales bacterium]|nr:hypothetical protein [Pseudomonadales bacterium]